MKNEQLKRYSIPNGNGTYRIPITGMDIRIEGNPPCIFGDLAQLIGRVENLGNLAQLEEIARNCKQQ